MGLPQREPNKRNDRNKEGESRISIKKNEEESRDNRPDDFRLSSGELRRIKQRNKHSAINGTSETGYGLKGVPHSKDILIFRSDKATSYTDVKQNLVKKEVNPISKIVCVSMRMLHTSRSEKLLRMVTCKAS